MKKKIVLLPLLALMLTACDLSSLMNNGGGNNNNEAPESREKSSLSPNDVAIKVANFVSVFPEVGDKVDLGEYITFEDVKYTLDQFTFTSLNPDVISIDNVNYKAECLKDGYAAISVTGPGLERAVEISFYVGSIAGHFVPDSRNLSGVIDLNIAGNVTDGYTFSLDVVSNGNKFNKRDIVNYNGAGSLLKNISPFLPMTFEGAAPSSFSPVGNYLIDLVGEQYVSEFKDLTNDVYGFMVADPVDGVILKMRFNESFIDLIPAK